MPLSAKQMEYLAIAFVCFETEPKIDFTKFAAIAGLASANSARVLFRTAKNKLKEEYGTLSQGYQSSSPMKSTPRRGAAAGRHADTAASPDKGPTKRGRGRPPKATAASAAAAAATDHDDDDDDNADNEEPAAKKAKKPDGTPSPMAPGIVIATPVKLVQVKDELDAGAEEMF